MSKEWKLTGVREYPGGKREYKIFGGLCEIATIPIVSGSDGTNEFTRANLFVAAPDLLEACKAAIKVVWPNVKIKEEAEILRQMEKAIARAEGNPCNK